MKCNGMTVPLFSTPEKFTREWLAKIRYCGTLNVFRRDKYTRFIEYVRDVLCPVLCDGDIVVMDNLSAHKESKT